MFISGAILGLCLVAGLVGLLACIQQRIRRKSSKHSSLETIKTSSNGHQIENFHATPVRVVDTNACLYYPAQPSAINESMSICIFLFYLDLFLFFVKCDQMEIYFTIQKYQMEFIQFKVSKRVTLRTKENSKEIK